MGSCSGGGLGCSGELSWWGVVQLGYCPGGEWSK